MDVSQSPSHEPRRVLAALAVIVAGTLILAARVCQPLVTAVPSTPPAVDPARIEAHVKKLSIDFHPRSFDHPANLERAAAYIEAQFRETGAQVQDVMVDANRYKKVVARFGPASGRLLVIGARYDCHGATRGARFDKLD
ncbi:MAG TPA: hypothetical protein VGD52_05350 [Pseudoduganella sp.]